jgi:hypothetical protein
MDAAYGVAASVTSDATVAGDKPWHTWVTLAIIVVACLPALVFEYLPMTDLPQQLAMASIIDNYNDAAYGFRTYYDIVPQLSHALVHAIVVGVGKLSSLQFAMRFAAFLSLLAYPIGVLALTRAARKPAWLALLAVPLIYHRSVFWGFTSFDISVGLALASFAAHIEPRKSFARDTAQALLAAGAFTAHIYGLALLFALVAGYAIFGGWRTLRRRWWTFLPLLLGTALWLVTWRSDAGYGATISPPLSLRAKVFADELLGGYQDSSELVILALFAAAWLVLALPTLPTSRDRLRSLTPLERLAWAAFVGNLAIYFLAPAATFTTKYLNFRHAFLAVAFLPLLAHDVPAGRGQFLKRALLAIAAGAATLNAWVHLMAFDREARAFNQIIAALPPAPKVVYMDFNPNGDIMKTFPYLHFHAYIQAQKGGAITSSFAELFWNAPVKVRADSGLPHTAVDFEWNPMFYNEKSFGYFYDYALLRIPYRRVVSMTPTFPYELVLVIPPWQLYKRATPPPASP